MTILEIKQLESNLNKYLYRMADYAKKRGVTTPCILKWIKEKKVKTITISNTVFIVEE